MHDDHVEERLRSVFRAESERLPLTITTAELERRLAARRRQAAGRRLSGIAAVFAIVAVGTIVSVGNGWLGLPVVATAPTPSPITTATPAPSLGPTPSPTFAAVRGVVRIVPTDGAIVLDEVLPTLTTEPVDGAFDADVPQDVYVVTVKVDCTGSGMTITDHDRQMPLQCQPADVPAEDRQSNIIDLQVIEARLALRWTVDADVAYAVLVERHPTPATLPSIEEPPGTVAVDAATANAAPRAGDARTVTESIGFVPPALTYYVSVVCLGPSEIEYALGKPDSPDFLASTRQVCDGVPRTDGFSFDAQGGREIWITSDRRVAWHVIVSGEGKLPIFAPPNLTLVKPVDLGGGDPVVPSGSLGCGLTATLKDGRKESDPCGATVWPDLSEDVAIFVRAGEQLWFRLPEDWPIAKPLVDAVPESAIAAGGQPSVTTLRSSIDRDGVLRVPAALEPGPWLIRVTVSSASEGDRFRASYLFRMTVVP